jgi:hypothetical protein
MRKLASSAVLLGWGIAFGADGGPPPTSVDPSISDVRSAGYWTDGDSDGSYRVVLSYGGREEINTTIVLEWVSRGGEDPAQPPSIAHSAILYGALLGTVEIRSFNSTKSGATLELVGTLQNGDKYHCEVRLVPGGKYSKGPTC